jgi:hypothetical protein
MTTTQFFEEYCKALLMFSAREIASHYHTPVTIYSDEGIRQVNDAAETLAFWEQGVQPYKEAGIEDAGFEILAEEQLSQQHYTAKVKWNNYDAEGKKVATETNFYILTQTSDGLKISGLVLMGN